MEDNAYKILVERLAKLQRNESQMTDQQKAEYAEQLKALRQKISTSAAAFAREYILCGTQIKQGQDADECKRRIQAIVRSDQARAEYKVATGVLFRTYSFEKFLEALLPSHYRVRYEGYAPYWCDHCRPYTGQSKDGKPLTFWNDIIEMGWSEKTKLWYRPNESRICLSLPPTMEQATAKYRAELQQWTERIAPSLQIPTGTGAEQ